MDAEEALIDAVRSRPILYDVSHDGYKSLKEKELAWRDVAEHLKLSEVECKKRWKTLRDSYNRCKRLQRSSSGTAEENIKKKWRFYDAMSFLDCITTCRSTFGKIYNYDDAFEIADIDETDGFLSPAPLTSKNIKGKKKTDSEKFQEFLDLAASSIAETSGTVARREQDSTSLHFESLAVKIKESGMPPSDVTILESKVSAVVFAEIEQFYAKRNEVKIEPHD